MLDFITYVVAGLVAGLIYQIALAWHRRIPPPKKPKVRVFGGGTFNIYSGGKWRECILSGVNIPEVGQPYGAEIKFRIGQLLKDADWIQVVYLGAGPEGRYFVRLLIDHPRLGGQVDVGRQLLQWGLAFVHNPPNDVWADYGLQQDVAQATKAGMWQGGNATPIRRDINGQ